MYSLYTKKYVIVFFEEKYTKSRFLRFITYVLILTKNDILKSWSNFLY